MDMPTVSIEADGSGPDREPFSPVVQKTPAA